MAKSKQSKAIRRAVAQIMPPRKQVRAARPRIRGRGGYIADFGSYAGRGIGSAAGGAVGGPIGKFIGGSAGGALGYGAGRLIEKIAGMGDYQANTNSIIKNTLMGRGQVPAFSSGKVQNVITHREYIQDITSGPAALVNAATPFQNLTFNINAGLGATFPWLSAVASNYEEYIFHGLVFEYVSLSADALNSTNTALGSVVMATQYNAASLPFTTKQQMENYDLAQSCRPSVDMVHGVECAVQQSIMPHGQYVRVGAVPTGQDIKTYDLGQFNIATVGMQQANVKLGELWVTFQVELRVPRLAQAVPGALYDFSAMTGSNPFANPVPNASNTLALTLAPTSVTLPSSISSGSYQMVFTVAGTVTTFAPWTAGVDVINLEVVYLASSLGAIQSIYFDVSGPGATLVVPASTFTSGTGSLTIAATPDFL